MIDNLDVMLWNKKVGSLVSSKKGYNNQICFYFDPAYAVGGYDIAPLRAPQSSVAVRKGLPIFPEEEKIFGGLPSFISDSLPDHWGNIVFSEWAKARHIPKRNLTALDMLAYIGHRGMGALEFIPPSSPDMESPFRVEIMELSKFTQIVLREAKKFHAVLSPDLIVESLFKVGTSAGGRRPKAVINLNPATGECFSGQVPMQEPGYVPIIIKFDEHNEVPTTRIEYSYYLMGKEAGLKMMPSNLFETSQEAHFMTERFDRKGVEKIHIQTLAAMIPHSNSYEHLFEAAQKLGISPIEKKQLFLQMAMNVACGNTDDHNKNFSFMMDKDGVWHAAPPYDFTFTVEASAPYYINRHSMTINGKNYGISKDDLMAVAEKFDIKCASTLIGKAIDAACAYRNYATAASVPQQWISIIEKEIASRVSALDK